ncbi:hypothetical protein [Streptomyces sp. NPDC096105]|uniref:hypothetical protein n=1 Tax=Streptomyces sp. NPDC096105 TaxID=3366074 RepID=UPI003822FB1E
MAAVALLATTLTLADATSFINFGALLGFTLVNVCVIAYAVRQWRSGDRPSLSGFVLLPLAGAAVDVYLLTQLDATATRLGLGWMAIGVVYLVVLTKGLRRPAPELRVDDQEPTAAAR